MKPWWTLDEEAAPVDLAALDLFALPANEVPRPGCEETERGDVAANDNEVRNGQA